jgi:hypothetical protein
MCSHGRSRTGRRPDGIFLPANIRRKKFPVMSRPAVNNGMLGVGTLDELYHPRATVRS